MNIERTIERARKQEEDREAKEAEVAVTGSSEQAKSSLPYFIDLPGEQKEIFVLANSGNEDWSKRITREIGKDIGKLRGEELGKKTDKEIYFIHMKRMLVLTHYTLIPPATESVAKAAMEYLQERIKENKGYYWDKIISDADFASLFHDQDALSTFIKSYPHCSENVSKRLGKILARPSANDTFVLPKTRMEEPMEIVINSRPARTAMYKREFGVEKPANTSLGEPSLTEPSKTIAEARSTVGFFVPPSVTVSNAYDSPQITTEKNTQLESIVGEHQKELEAEIKPVSTSPPKSALTEALKSITETSSSAVLFVPPSAAVSNPDTSPQSPSLTTTPAEKTTAEAAVEPLKQNPLLRVDVDDPSRSDSVSHQHEEDFVESLRWFRL